MFWVHCFLLDCVGLWKGGQMIPWLQNFIGLGKALYLNQSATKGDGSYGEVVRWWELREDFPEIVHLERTLNDR